MATQLDHDQIRPLSITNAEIALAAAIAYSKLNLTGAIVNADIVSLAWSKLTGTPTTLAGYGITSPIAAADGGTGLASYAVGDLLYASGATTLSTLAGVAVGQVLVSGGVGAAPAWSALPTLSGGLILGVQGTGGAALRVAHAEPAGALPNAYYGVTLRTFTWTNNGTYYDHTGFYGWNENFAEATEPQFGLSLESKFSQGSGQPFLVEFHHAASFPDATSVRVLTQTIDRAAPHLATNAIAGQVDFLTSSTAAAQVLNLRITEAGTITVFNGSSITVRNYANGASNTGKGEYELQSSDAYPGIAWRKSGAQKASLFCDLALGAVEVNVGFVAGGRFGVQNGQLFCYQSSATATAFKLQSSGGDMMFLSTDGSNAKFRLTHAGLLALGLATPTAVLHLKAGTATANTAPLKFTSGTLLTTAEAGAIEFLTDAFYGTVTTGAARHTFVTEQRANTFTLINPLTTIAESWIGPSATTGIYFKADKVGIGTTGPVATLDVTGTFAVNPGTFFSAVDGSAIFVARGSGSASVWYYLDPDAPIYFGSNTAATAGVTARQSPSLRWLGTRWTGAASATLQAQAQLNPRALIDASFLAFGFSDNDGQMLCLTHGSKLGLGTNSPSARLHLPAGAAAANSAPLKINPGTNLTTPELGAIELTDDGTTGHLYVTLNVAGVVTRVQIV